MRKVYLIHFFSPVHQLRPLWTILLVLFSVQIVMMNLSLAQCHSETSQEHIHLERTEIQVPRTQAEAENTHCDGFGFCLFGHCHFNHGSVILSETKLQLVTQMESSLGFIKEDSLWTQWTLDKLWQPPRI